MIKIKELDLCCKKVNMIIKILRQSYQIFCKKRKNKYKDQNNKILNIGYRLAAQKGYIINKNLIKIIIKFKIRGRIAQPYKY